MLDISLHLFQLFFLSLSSTQVRYRDDLRDIAMLYPSFSFLTPELRLILDQYQAVAVAPVDWELYTNLSNSQHLINASNQLRQVLINLVRAVMQF